MRVEVNTDVDIDVDEIVDKKDQAEKIAMCAMLETELGKAEYKPDFDVAKFFGSLSLYEQKKILCNALNVPNYVDEQALRQALEKIIKA